MSEDQRHWTDPRDGTAHDGPTLDPESARREMVGRTLRLARERAGWSLREVADALRIRYDYLEAIERSDFERLPGQAYAIGFVRSYANALELDDEEIVRRFKEEVAGGLNRAQDLSFPKPVNEGKVPGGALLLVSLILAAGAYGGWYYLTKSESDIADMVPPVPERLQALLGEGAPSGDPGATGASAEEAPTVSQFATGPDPADDPSGGPTATQTVAPEAQATVEAAGQAEPAETGTGTGSQPPETAATPASPDGDTGSGTTETADTDSPGSTQIANAASDSQAPDIQTPDTPAPASETPDTQASGSAATSPTPEAPTPEAPATAPEVPDTEGVRETETAVDSGPADGATAEAAPEANPGTETGTAVDAGTGDAIPEPPGLASDDTGGGESEPAPAPTDSTTSEGLASGEVAPTAALPDVQAPTADGEAADDEAAGAEPAATNVSDAQREILDNAERVFGQSNADSRLVLRATQDSWVQVRGPDDSLLLTRVLNPGDVYRVPNQQGLVLHTGNAGGLSLYLDGRETARLGETGDVRRNISLDPDSLR